MRLCVYVLELYNHVSVVCFFFFQAEDGIRDLVRSRGLGDVYKRQAQDRGFQAQLYEGDIEDLKTQVREGRPIIAFINRGTRMFPIGHYVVVTGYSESRRGLFVHSGDTPNRFVPTSRFLKQWEKTSRTTLRIDGPVP